MNNDIMKGKWNQFKGEVKKQWGDLTDDDLRQIDGEQDKLVGRVQERYGYTRQEAQREVDDYFKSRPTH